MKIFIFFMILMCVALSSRAQNRIEGKVLNDKQEPVSFCALALLRESDSSLVKGNLSGETGEFTFEAMPAGRYILKAVSVGFKPFFSSPLAIDTASRLMLEPFILSPDATTLNEVSVAAFRPTVEFKKGIVVLNTDNDLIARGNTVLDLLKRLPGVIVDAQNSVSINGNKNVRFLMDGRLQQIPTSQMINILSSMSAESISSIELIKNPPARYDAAGAGGLINIVTKKAKLKGFSGSVAQSYSQGIRARYNTTAGLNYKNNRLSVFGNINAGYYTFEDQTELDRVLNNTATTNAFNATGKIVNPTQALNLSAGLEYDLDAKTTAGIYFNNNLNINNPVQNAKTQVLEGDAFNYSTFTYHTDHQKSYNSPTLNMSLLHKIDSLGSQLQYQGDYNNLVGEEKKLIDNRFYNSLGEEIPERSYYNTNIHNDYKILNQKLDYTKVFKHGATLDAGAKGGFVNINSSNMLSLHNSTAGFYNGDTIFNNDYVYKERILAAYATLAKEFKKLGFTAGLRAEQTNIDATNKTTGYHLTRNYINLFPSGSLDIHLNKKNSISAAYSYRIDRPSYDMMNPVRVFNDQLNYSVGNSELKPQYTHLITVDYNFNNLMTTSIGYQRTNDFTFYYTYAKPGSQVNIDTMFNFPLNTNLVLSEFVQKQLKWYNVQLYANVMYRTFSGGTVNGQNVSSQTIGSYSSINNEFTLPKGFKLTVNAYYVARSRDGMQVYYPNSNVSVVINKNMLNDKFSVTLGFFDIFWKSYSPFTSQLPDQYMYYRQMEDSRRVRLNLLWKFGKMKIEQKLNSQEDNDRFKKK